jgi:hypothetical protein
MNAKKNNALSQRMNINSALPRSLAAISVHRNTTDQIIRVEMSWDGDEIGYFGNNSNVIK